MGCLTGGGGVFLSSRVVVVVLRSHGMRGFVGWRGRGRGEKGGRERGCVLGGAGGAGGWFEGRLVEDGGGNLFVGGGCVFGRGG